MIFFRILALLSVPVLFGSCQHAPHPGYAELPEVQAKRQSLKQQLLELLPRQERAAAAAEATWLADTAYKASAAIARHNDPVFVNWLNNRAVNTRHNYRHRGLCWHYQHDLYRELRRRPLKFFKLGCCVRDQGTGSEHHVVYVMGREGKWPAAVTLDAWWSAGRLRVENAGDDEWVDNPKSTQALNTIYPAGHKRPLEHWSMVRKGTRYADYIYSDYPEARKTSQWQYMQQQIKAGMQRRGGKPFDY